jgi:glycosyltransferase involved in cell wall biosynthesis
VPWVLVSPNFFTQGGQSKANAALADYLVQRGTPVHLVGHEIPDSYRRHGCTVHVVRRPVGVYFLDGLWLRQRSSQVVRRLVATYPGARVVVNGGCCDWGDINWVHYVHAGWSYPAQQLPAAARLKAAVATRLYRLQEQQALRAARLVLANSQGTRQLLIDRLGLEAEKVHTVYLGTDPEWGPVGVTERKAARSWLGLDTDRPLVVFVGGLGHDDRKGFDTLWEAWRALCAAPDWDADLIVAGGGPALPLWQGRIAQAGLARRVRLIGFTDRIPDVLAAADLLVSPVRYEPYGLNVQEAICRGVPALVSACAGVAEQYPPELADMILPDPNNVSDLAARLRRWREDRRGWQTRFRPLTQRLRGDTWQDMAAQIVALAENELQSTEAPTRQSRYPVFAG